MTSFNKCVKDEIKKHVSKNFKFNFIKASYDLTEVKKDIRKKFIDNGFVYSPEVGHHLEFKFKELNDANITLQELSICDIPSKISYKEKTNCYYVYITDAKNILKTLKILGSNHSLKHYNDIYEYNLKAKDTNRKVNFEAANIKRSTDAAVKQLKLINKLLKKRKISELDDDIKIVVKARLKYKMASMNELSEKIGNISKSAINHRFLKIKKILGD